MHPSTGYKPSEADTARSRPAVKRYYLIAPLIMMIILMALPAAQSQAASKAFISEKASKEGYQKVGDKFYARRAEGFKNGQVDPSMINKALAAYQKAYALGDDSEELVVKLMRATYFYVTYAEKTTARQKKALTEVIEIGEKALLKDPNSVALNYQMAGAWGRRGEINGIFASARQGVADKIKDFGEAAERIDPSYAEGGAYRTLGRLYFKAPHIPFILSWPSKKKSLDYLKKAIKIGPTNLTNHLFLAETLIANGKEEKALRQIDYILIARINPTKQVEDFQDKKDAQLLKEKISGKVKQKNK